MTSSRPAPRAAPFSTCPVDAIRPGVGFVAISPLESAGSVAEVAPGPTGCSEPSLTWMIATAQGRGGEVHRGLRPGTEGRRVVVESATVVHCLEVGAEIEARRTYTSK